MPGAPLGNKPKAFRFKPGIRLDWSCREMRTSIKTKYASQVVDLFTHNINSSYIHKVTQSHSFKALRFQGTACNAIYDFKQGRLGNKENY